jgi:methyl-accepting chemotaxis protein
MFRNLKLGKKIGFGFGCVAILLMFAVGTALWALRGASNGFTEYREDACDSNLASEFQSTLLGARMSFIYFLWRNDGKYADQFRQRSVELLDCVDRMAKDREFAEQYPEQLAAIQEGLREYLDGFDTVIRLTAERDRLDHEIIRKRGAAIVDQFETLAEAKAKGQDHATANCLRDAMGKVLEARVAVRFFVEDESQESLKKVIEAVARFDEHLKEVAPTLKTAEERQWFERIGQEKKEYLDAVNAFVKTADTRNQLVASKLAPLGNLMVAKAEEVNRGIKDNQDRLGPQVAASNQRAMMVVPGITLVAACVAIAMALIITRVVTKPLHATVAMLRDIAQGEGDLTKRLQVRSKDEIGEMAECFNTFVEKLQGIIARLAKNTTALSASSQELSATATQLASGAEEATSQSATVVAAAEQMATNMTGMAAATEEMSTNVKVAASSVDQLNASIGEVARSAEQAATVAGNAAQLASHSNASIGELGTAADQIGKVIEVIQDIAEQTNLLALNATIEAARAGEAGKGFAVVATEVKELARQTAGATEDIRKRIEGIQQSTGQAVKSIGDIEEVIRQVNDLSRTIASAVEEQSITTKEIARNVSQTATAAQTVARGVAESATASQEITRTMVGVDQATKQAAQGASQARTAGSELSDLAEQLNSLVTQFKIDGSSGVSA